MYIKVFLDISFGCLGSYFKSSSCISEFYKFSKISMFTEKKPKLLKSCPPCMIYICSFFVVLTKVIYIRVVFFLIDDPQMESCTF